MVQGEASAYGAEESERSFQARVLRAAQDLGWLVFHDYDARGNPSGFLDTWAIKPGQPLLALELKVGRRKATIEQLRWLHVLPLARGIISGVYYPKDYEAILQLLKGASPKEEAPISDTPRLDAATPQPAPLPGQETVLPLVLADLCARAEMGLQKYGTTLMTYNGRDALQDAYQEALDLVMYLRQALAEREQSPSPEQGSS